MPTKLFHKGEAKTDHLSIPASENVDRTANVALEFWKSKLLLNILSRNMVIQIWTTESVLHKSDLSVSVCAVKHVCCALQS